MEYHPQSPFNAGMPEMTGNENVQSLRQMAGRWADHYIKN
jgi:hypothetical protein